MGYANPVERYDQIHGEDAFVNHAAAAGVDGVLIVDYPPEECEEFAAKLKARDMDLIFLLAPTSTDERMQQVARVASGYVYYVSLKGVTGSGALDTSAVEAMLPRIRQHVSVPVGVGFGIRDAQTAQTVGQVADAVIIGSRIIDLLDNQPHEKIVPLAIDFLRGVRKLSTHNAALKSAPPERLCRFPLKGDDSLAAGRPLLAVPDRDCASACAAPLSWVAGGAQCSGN
jgi:tryptophan synthase alpha chain